MRKFGAIFAIFCAVSGLFGDEIINLPPSAAGATGAANPANPALNPAANPAAQNAAQTANLATNPPAQNAATPPQNATNPPAQPPPNAAQNPINRVINCNAIFESRKNELVETIAKIEQDKRLMTSLYNEQQAKNAKKLQELQAKEEKIAQLLAEVRKKEEDIKGLIKQNEELLASIQSTKTEKITQTYSKMRDSKAGSIIENMSLKQAAELLFSMDSKDMGKILAKMTPQKAAQLTELIKSGPPFEVME